MYAQATINAVRIAKANKQWRREYMTLMMRDLENQEIGMKQGRDTERRENIAAMLRKGKKPEDIADFCDYPISLVKEVEQGMMVLQ